MSLDPSRYYTLDQVAAMLGCTPRHARRMAGKDGFPPAIHPTPRKTFFPRDKVDSYLRRKGLR